MADKRKDLESKLNKLSQARDRITEQLEEAERKTTQLQVKVNGELMEGESSKSLQELTTTRELVSSLHQALQFANAQLKEAREQLSDFDRAAKGGMIMEMDKKVQQAVVDLQAKIGETGLKAEVDNLGELIVELGRLSNSDVKIQDVDIHLATARSIQDHLSRSLLASWQEIESLKWGPQHSTDAEKGNLPGFGRLPGSLINS
jgi:predicted house-cleaning noncanonical NTP pyrophosphatase (MazG superfamily)